MKEKPHLNRKYNATRYMTMLGVLLYIIEKDDQKDYLLLMAIKYYRYISQAVKKVKIQYLFRMTEGQLDEAIDRMRAKGWIAEQDGYLTSTSFGDMEFQAIGGWVGQAIYNLKHHKPIYEWNKSKK